jgi:hypothetical protein
MSYVNLFNFFEVENIHPESKRDFHIKISLKTTLNLCGTGVCSATISLVLHKKFCYDVLGEKSSGKGQPG